MRMLNRYLSQNIASESLLDEEAKESPERLGEHSWPSPSFPDVSSEPEDLGSLTPEELIRRLRGVTRLISHYEALRLDAEMAIVDLYQKDFGDMGLAMDGAEAELRAALMLTRRAANMELALAEILRERLPSVLESLRSGSIDRRRATVIANKTLHLPEADARELCAEVLPIASGMTTGQLKAWIDRRCIEHNPTEAKDRFKEARTIRGVFAELADDGTATLTATGLMPDKVVNFMDRLTQTAFAFKTAEEPRTRDQIRADIFEDIMTGEDATKGRSRKAIADIRISPTTLMGLDDKAIELSGFGPVIADIGRGVAARGIEAGNAEWRFTVKDKSGRAVTGLTQRRPSAKLRRTVEARDESCIFPGCRAPATNCDLDHRIPYSEGGLTHEDQLVPLCRHDHVIRHNGWSHQPNPDGSHTWTSPIGLTHTTARAP
jgi:multimeric flavodoxin WrbA